MSTIRTLLKDNFDTELQIQGARAQNSNDDISSVVFTNYDNDTSNIYRLAEIVARDNYGSTTLNGYGNMVFKVNQTGGCNLSDAMVIKHNGFVGVNTLEPVSQLSVNGNVSACNLLYSTQAVYHPFHRCLQLNSNVFSRAYGWLSDSRPLSNVDVRAFASGSNSSYVLRLYDLDSNVEIARTPATLSNTRAAMVNLPARFTRSNQALELHAQGNGTIVLDGMLVKFV